MIQNQEKMNQFQVGVQGLKFELLIHQLLFPFDEVHVEVDDFEVQFPLSQLDSLYLPRVFAFSHPFENFQDIWQNTLQINLIALM